MADELPAGWSSSARSRELCYKKRGAIGGGLAAVASTGAACLVTGTGAYQGTLN